MDKISTECKETSPLILEQLLTQARAAVSAIRYAVFRWQDNASVCVRRHGVSASFVDALRRADGYQALLELFQRGEPAVLREPLTAEEAAAWRAEGIAGAFLLPLWRDHSLNGVAALYFDRPIDVDAATRWAARTLASILAQVLDPQWFESDRPMTGGRPAPRDELLMLVQQEFQARLESLATAIGCGRRALVQVCEPHTFQAVDWPLELADWHIEVMNRMLGDLCEAGVVDLGAPALSTQPHLLAELVPAIVDRVRPYAGDLAVRSSVHESGAPILAPIDPMWLEVAMGHLIATVATRCSRRATIDVKLLRGKRPRGPDCAVIAVAYQAEASDRGGRGRWPGELGAPATPVDAEGRTLGVAVGLARKIIEAHGGRLWADGPDDRGTTTISLALPLAVASSAVQECPAEVTQRYRLG